jgi:hypothetical protein
MPCSITAVKSFIVEAPGLCAFKDPEKIVKDSEDNWRKNICTQFYKTFSAKFTPKSASFVEIWTEFTPILGVNYAEKSFVKSVRK